MIEIRPLNRMELNQLLIEAPLQEKENLFKVLDTNNVYAYDFLNNEYVVYRYGLIIDNRPIYFAHVVKNDNRYELWTIVNSEVKHQKTLYKHSKLALQEALKQFSPIYATMEKHLIKNLKWTEHLGFKRIYENAEIVTLKIGE